MSAITSQDLDSVLPLDKEWVHARLSEFPFVKIDGVTNARTLGPYPVKREDGSAGTTRSKQLYRSAEVSGITAKGVAQLRELNIKKIFDLRSDTEMKKYDTPIPTVRDVEIVHAPVFKTEDYSPEVMAGRFQLYAKGDTEAFMQLYSQILDAGGKAFAEILKHVRDRPGDGCLFHCTAGKDRTAVIAAILLSIAGVDDEIIAEDYSLTRVGREPVRDMILARLQKEPIFKENKDKALNLLTSRRETMIAFLNLLRTNYGGAKSYAKNFCGLSDIDIQTIRRNLVILEH